MWSSLRNIPWPYAMLLVFIFSIFLSWILLVISRRWRDSEVTLHTQILTILLSFVTLVFGIQVSFVIVLQQEWLNNGKKAVIEEATYIAGMLNDVKKFDEKNEKAIKNVIFEYLNYMINDEWPAIQRGEYYFPKGDALIAKMWDTYKSMSVTNTQQKIVYEMALTDLKTFFHARNVRLSLSQSALHPMLWTWILILGLGAIVLVSLLPIKRFSLNMLLMTVYTLVIVMILFITYTLDHPFQGQIKIEPTEFENLIPYYRQQHENRR